MLATAHSWWILTIFYLAGVIAVLVAVFLSVVLLISAFTEPRQKK